MKKIISIVTALLLSWQMLAQKSRINGFELVSEPFKDSTYDWCAGGAFQLPYFYVNNSTNDTIRDYSNGMAIYYVQDSSKKWNLLGDSETLKLFELAKSSEFDPILNLFSEDGKSKIQSVKIDMKRRHRLLNPGINETCFDRLKYPFETFLNMEKDTSYVIKATYRKPITKTQYLQTDKIFVLSTKLCFNKEQQERKLNKYLDSLESSSKNNKMDRNQRISNTLKYINTLSNQYYKDYFYIRLYQNYNPVFMNDIQANDSISYCLFIKKTFFNDTLFGNIIKSLPNERQAFFFLDRTLNQYLKYYRNDYEGQVGLTLQSLKLLSECPPAIKNYIPRAYRFMQDYIKREGAVHRKGELDKRVLNYIGEISKK